MAKARTKHRRRRSPPSRRGGMLMGMRSGFKNMADAVTGETGKQSSPWLGRVITVLIVLAAAGLIFTQF